MRRARRFLLGAAVIGGIAVPWLTSCSAGFEAPSKIDGIRVLAVAADKSFANPGDTVHLTMTYDADGAFADVTPSILWISDCFDPDGDTYYGCYAQFADLLGDLKNGELPPPGSVSPPIKGLVDWQVTLPDDIVTNHPAPATGSNFGVAYVFFLVCAGDIKVAPTATQGDGGLAGNFPLGCFDKNGNEIGAEGFVPGFTEVYAFADGRTNANPPAKSLLIKRVEQPDSAYREFPSDPDHPYAVDDCAVSEDDRRKLGCGNQPFTTCSAYNIDVSVDGSVSETDPGSPENGTLLHEAVWIDWYTDGGDFDNDVSLVYDPHHGLVSTGDRAVQWIAPSTKGTYSIWGVLHDARGGTNVLRGYVDAE